jgi:hypothetical protein
MEERFDAIHLAGKGGNSLMGNGANPYILFLILILLVMGFDQDAGKKLEVMRNVMDRMSSAMNNFNVGMNAMAGDFEEIHMLMTGMK